MGGHLIITQVIFVTNLNLYISICFTLCMVPVVAALAVLAAGAGLLGLLWTGPSLSGLGTLFKILDPSGLAGLSPVHWLGGLCGAFNLGPVFSCFKTEKENRNSS